MSRRARLELASPRPPRLEAGVLSASMPRTGPGALSTRGTLWEIRAQGMGADGGLVLPQVFT